MSYDPYKEFPQLAPATVDLSPLMDIVIAVKEAVKIRHDFQTAAQIANNARSLHPPKWESNFAHTARPDAKTLQGLAAEHNRLRVDALQRATAIRGNPQLGKLVRENLALLFPDIGFSAVSGNALLRLQPPQAGILKVFHPLGVDDNANLIRLLTKRFGNIFYW